MGEDLRAFTMIVVSFPTPPPSPRNDGWSRSKSPGGESLITLTQDWPLSKSLLPSEHAGFDYCIPPLSQLSLDTKDPFAESKYIPGIKTQQHSSPINNGLLQESRGQGWNLKMSLELFVCSVPEFQKFFYFYKPDWQVPPPLPTPQPPNHTASGKMYLHYPLSPFVTLPVAVRANPQFIIISQAVTIFYFFNPHSRICLLILEIKEEGRKRERGKH